MASALEAQIAEYLRQADFKLYGLQQRAIAATNAAPPSPANFVRAVFSDSVFPQSYGKDLDVRQGGVVKYGRRGEYLLHIGVDEAVSLLVYFSLHYRSLLLFPPDLQPNPLLIAQLFPHQPPADISNKQRLKVKAKAQAAASQARRAVGSADEFAGAAKAKGEQAKNEARKEGEDLRFAAQEKKRREERKEGWRSEAFDV